MLDKLTPKQVKLIKEVRDEWINRFNSLEFDEDKSRDFVDFLYGLSGNKRPIKVILDSPLALQIACNMDKNSQVESQLRSQVRSQVGSQVRSQVESQNLKYFYESYYGRCDDAVWISFYDFFERIGIIEHKLFRELKDYIKCGLFCFIAQENIAYISKPPEFLKRDEKGRMHCIDDYAIYFKDGFGLHYVHGVYFSPELFDRFFMKKVFDGKEIMNLKNTEQKAVLIQEYGYEKIINEIKDKKIIETIKVRNPLRNKDMEYQLIDFKIDNIHARFVKVEDFSTGKITCLGVPVQKSTETCKGAISWTFPTKVYEPDIET